MFTELFDPIVFTREGLFSKI